MKVKEQLTTCNRQIKPTGKV